MVTALSVLVLAGACSSAPLPRAGTTTTEPPPTSTTLRPSASGQLAGFVSAALQVDARLKAAAAAVNGDMHATGATFDAATLAVIKAADPAPAAAAIPPGLPPALLQASLVVYADLASRRAAFNDVWEGTFSTSSPDYESYLLPCLHTGAVSAARFDGDLAALERLASASPPVVVVAPDSRAAEELAVLVNWIDLGNNGCGSCGGFVPDHLPTVSWSPAPGQSTEYFGPVAGNIDGLNFSATYSPGSGWAIVLQAC